MAAPVIIGVDPGGQSVGIAVRHRDELLHHQLLTRSNTIGAGVMAFWLQSVTHGIRDAIRAIPDGLPDATAIPKVAVEGLNPPTPHLGITSVEGLLDTAQVLGAIQATWSGAVIVPPAGHGSGPLTAYPAPLRPTRGKGRGQDQLRHCRSAWSIAGAAAVQIRLTEATR